MDLSAMERGLVQRPPKLTGRDMWFDWKFDVENFLVPVNSRYATDMITVEASVDPIGDDAEPTRAFQILYAFLAGLVTGRAKQILKEDRSTRNGYETWRKLCREFEPKSDMWKLATIHKLVSATMLQNLTNRQFVEGLGKWEALCREYGEMGGTAADDLKRATF